MKDIDKIKLAFVTIFTALNTALGALAMPFYILVATNVIDYITGISASACRGEAVSSYRGFRGIAKKICMWLLVLVGYITDWLVVAVGHTINLDIGFKCLVAFVVIFWLLANELISILENITDIMGENHMPPFLLKTIKYIKIKTEESVDTIPTENHDK